MLTEGRYYFAKQLRCTNSVCRAGPGGPGGPGGQSPAKGLSESLGQLSLEGGAGPGLGLARDQVARLQEAAAPPGDQHQTSAMDRFMQMKTQQELDNISCNH